MLKKKKRKTRKQNNTVRRRRKRRRDAKKESPSRSQTRARTRSSRNVCINTQNVPSENEEETDLVRRESCANKHCKYPKTPSPRQPLLLFYISFLFYSQPRRRTAQEYFTRDAKLPGDEERQVPKETHRPFTRFQGTDESRGVHDSFSRRPSRG